MLYIQGMDLYALFNGFVGKLRIFIFAAFVAAILLVCCWDPNPNPSDPTASTGSALTPKPSWMQRLSSDVQQIREFLFAEMEEIRDVTMDNLAAISDVFKNAFSDTPPTTVQDVPRVEIDDFETTSKRLNARRALESDVAKLLSNSP